METKLHNRIKSIWIHIDKAKDRTELLSHELFIGKYYVSQEDYKTIKSYLDEIDDLLTKAHATINTLIDEIGD